MPVSSLYWPSASWKAEICSLRGDDAGLIAATAAGGADDGGEQRDDRDDHEHFDQRDAGPGICFVIRGFMIDCSYIATSLILVIAISILSTSAPTIRPIMRITSGSKMEVKRLMEERVSSS